ncbi:hypothetical protein P154DRAFT_573170 [Amniculicola lignicola CBS 123094]|uniref:Uncharacterized protein n=1 Tax=Amniculicola lignicola CBS 123094 TaxID=1392246 RepID=A0A6A5WRK7_9PLEO|nr:hypothetical protein P154DRAFT_573170 [Amniculicola lignicola CBS 123094]
MVEQQVILAGSDGAIASYKSGHAAWMAGDEVFTTLLRRPGMRGMRRRSWTCLRRLQTLPAFESGQMFNGDGPMAARSVDCSPELPLSAAIYHLTCAVPPVKVPPSAVEKQVLGPGTRSFSSFSSFPAPSPSTSAAPSHGLLEHAPLRAARQADRRQLAPRPCQQCPMLCLPPLKRGFKGPARQPVLSLAISTPTIPPLNGLQSPAHSPPNLIPRYQTAHPLDISRGSRARAPLQHHVRQPDNAVGCLCTLSGQ